MKILTTGQNKDQDTVYRSHLKPSVSSFISTNQAANKKQVLFSFPFYFYGLIGGLKIELHLLSQRRNAVLTSVYTFISYWIAVNLDGTSSGTPCLVHEWEDCHNQKCFRHKQIWNNLPTDWKRKGWFWRSLNVLLMWFQGHTFRFSNVFYILKNFTHIKAPWLFLRTLLLVIFAEAFTENLLFRLGRRWERWGTTQSRRLN